MARPSPSRISQTEFIALTGMIMAAVAFGTDAMMPAMTVIAADLTPEAPNKAQLVISAFFLGVGIGTFVTGPLADRFGRRPVMLGGLILYAGTALLAWFATSLEWVLIARVLQGLGAAGPRVTIMAVIRDQFEGRRMAQIMSFAMMVFVLVPAAAPMMGSWIIAASNWRGIFVAFAIWAAVMALWFAMRQAETLPHDKHRPLRPIAIARGTAEILRNREVMLAVTGLIFVYGILIATLQSVQPIFETTHDKGALFPYFFGAISLISATGSFVNARIVAQYGMKPVALTGISTVIVASAVLLMAESIGLAQPVRFAVFLLFLQMMFLSTGMTIGNISAIAMRPLGHQAGLGASVISALSTIGGLLVGMPIGLLFDGTALPLALGAFLAALASAAFVSRLPMDTD